MQQTWVWVRSAPALTLLTFDSYSVRPEDPSIPGVHPGQVNHRDPTQDLLTEVTMQTRKLGRTPVYRGQRGEC